LCEVCYERRAKLSAVILTSIAEIVKEVAGLAPYERRVIELLRNSKDKRARYGVLAMNSDIGLLF
jgi:hypothetical protein